MPKPGILQIAYYFPPIKTVGTLRNARFAQSAPQYWDKHYIISTAHTEVFDIENLDLPESSIIRIPSYDFRFLFWRLRRKKATYFNAELKQKGGVRVLRRLLDSFPFNVLLGDGGWWYIVRGYRQAKVLIQKEGISHLYSSFRPLSDHVLAYLLVRRFPHLVWIADFRDVPVDPWLRNVYWPGFQHWILRKIFRRAQFFTTVSAGLAQHLEQHYRRPVQVMYNAPMAEQSEQASKQRFPQFTIAYTGSLYPEQNAKQLFQAIQALIQEGKMPRHNIKLLTCGKDGATWESWAAEFDLKNMLENRGVISHAEALSIQHSTQINVLLSWNSPGLQGILTSKVFEYLQARVPILTLVNGDKEAELEVLLHNYSPHNLVVYPADDLQGIKDFLYFHYQNWQEQRPSPADVRKVPDWEGEMGKVFFNEK